MHDKLQNMVIWFGCYRSIVSCGFDDDWTYMQLIRSAECVAMYENVQGWRTGKTKIVNKI